MYSTQLVQQPQVGLLYTVSCVRAVVGFICACATGALSASMTRSTARAERAVKDIMVLGYIVQWLSWSGLRPRITRISRISHLKNINPL